MSMPPPQVDPRVGVKPIPRPQDADYSDEINVKQYQAMQRYSEQDESRMGPVVDELTW